MEFSGLVFFPPKKNRSERPDEAGEVYEARAFRALARRLADPASSDPSDPSDPLLGCWMLGRWGLPSTLPLDMDGVGLSIFRRETPGPILSPGN